MPWQAAAPVDVRDGPSAADSLIGYLFEQVLNRAPGPAEQQACREILERQRGLAANPDAPDALRQARESLARVLLNHNDFLTVR